MQSTILSTVTLLLATTLASPLTPRDTCNSRPTGPSGTQPRSQPSAATANLCQAKCTADSDCQAFIFGLPSGATAPDCMLFGVPAAQVPAQSDPNLMVFDRACTGLSTTAPTNSGSNTGSNTGNNTPTKPGNANPPGNPSNDPTNGGPKNGSPGGNKGGPKARRASADQCGGAPAGPSTSAPSPLSANPSIGSQPACLALCKATSGCKS
jgi:hypothetical protein